MKYTTRHVRKFQSEGKIDASLWTEHFSQALVSHVPTCNDCKDYKTKSCEGGKDPVDCFLAIKLVTDKPSGAGMDDENQTIKDRKYYKSSRGNIKSNPTGIQKGFDQSKK